MNEHDEELAELLRRDAGRIREGGRFDAKLHQDTMRAIRQLEPSTRGGERFSPKRLAMVLTALTACVLLLLALQRTPGPPSPAPSMAATAPATTALAYRSALAEGEDALMAMLDQDALVLLPRSADVFQSGH